MNSGPDLQPGLEEVTINPGWNWGDILAAQSKDFEILGLPNNGTLAGQVVVPADEVNDALEKMRSKNQQGKLVLDFASR